jgi:hypothetical protein
MCRKPLSLFVLVSFFVSSLGPLPKAHANELGLPVPGSMVNLSSAFEPVLIKGLKVHPENPFAFDFILDTGNSNFQAEDPALKQESNKLIKYFLAAMTVPEKNLWVNLSPYEKDRMMADDLGQTEMGRDMLAQDYLLKQLTASLIYPEKELGKEFWNRVHAKAQQLYGTSEVPVNTFNKVWIVADKADVFERANVAYVVGAHLKVMLEEDYLAKDKNKIVPGTNLSNQIVREVILPEIEKEINTGKTFGPLRQMFYSMILASWYKMALKDALLTQVYGNQSKIKTSINAADESQKDKIYQQYLEAYKKGVFNYIREDINAAAKQPMPRKYFSGGLQLIKDPAQLIREVGTIPPGAISNNSAFAASIVITIKKELGKDATVQEKVETIMIGSEGPFDADEVFDAVKDLSNADRNFDPTRLTLYSGRTFKSLDEKQRKHREIIKLIINKMAEYLSSLQQFKGKIKVSYRYSRSTLPVHEIIYLGYSDGRLGAEALLEKLKMLDQAVNNWMNNFYESLNDPAMASDNTRRDKSRDRARRLLRDQVAENQIRLSRIDRKYREGGPFESGADLSEAIMRAEERDRIHDEDELDEAMNARGMTEKYDGRIIPIEEKLLLENVPVGKEIKFALPGAIPGFRGFLIYDQQGVSRPFPVFLAEDNTVDVTSVLWEERLVKGQSTEHDGVKFLFDGENITVTNVGSGAWKDFLLMPADAAMNFHYDHENDHPELIVLYRALDLSGKKLPVVNSFFFGAFVGYSGIPQPMGQPIASDKKLKLHLMPGSNGYWLVSAGGGNDLGGALYLGNDERLARKFFSSFIEDLRSFSGNIIEALDSFTVSFIEQNDLLKQSEDSAPGRLLSRTAAQVYLNLQNKLGRPSRTVPTRDIAKEVGVSQELINSAINYLVQKGLALYGTGEQKGTLFIIDSLGTQAILDRLLGLDEAMTSPPGVRTIIDIVQKNLTTMWYDELLIAEFPADHTEEFIRAMDWLGNEVEKDIPGIRDEIETRVTLGSHGAGAASFFKKPSGPKSKEFRKNLSVVLQKIQKSLPQANEKKFSSWDVGASTQALLGEVVGSFGNQTGVLQQLRALELGLLKKGAATSGIRQTPIIDSAMALTKANEVITADGITKGRKFDLGKLGNRKTIEILEVDGEDVKLKIRNQNTTTTGWGFVARLVKLLNEANIEKDFHAMQDYVLMHPYKRIISYNMDFNAARGYKQGPGKRVSSRGFSCNRFYCRGIEALYCV